MAESGERTFRIYVGGISPSLAASIGDLQKRMEKYGRVLGDFEVHYNEVQERHFGYVTLETSATRVASLQKVMGGVNFKGSKLTVDLAKPDWQKRWEKDSRRQDTKIAQRKQRQRITDARLERISKRGVNPFEQALVSKGRLRKSARKDVKNMTLRVEIKGRVRLIKCKKTKLWGIAKNRGIKDLTRRFIAGEWRDGSDHVIDRLVSKIVVFGNDGITVEDYEDKPVEQELTEEQGKTNKVLAGLLSQYDFDRPVELEEDEDPLGGSDYEFNKNSDGEEEEIVDVKYEVPAKDCVKPSQETIVKEYLEEHPELLHQSGLPAPYNEDDDEDDDEFYKSLRPAQEEEDYEAALENERKPEQQVISKPAEEDVDEDHDDEFIPSFGGKSEGEAISELAPADESEDEFIPSFGKAEESTQANTTEALRSLLNPIETTQRRTEEIQPVMEDVPVPTFNHKKSLGLFFAHFDSPFLVAQSQVNKFPAVDMEEDNWDKWFWENRGDLNREFRRRRRDVLKKNRKIQGKVSVI